jgi:hypothetical protein
MQLGPYQPFRGDFTTYGQPGGEAQHLFYPALGRRA